MNIGEVMVRLLPDTQAHSSGPDHPFGGCRERADLTPGGQLDLSALTQTCNPVSLNGLGGRAGVWE